MTIKLVCVCGKMLKAPDSAAGRKGKCSGCGKVTNIPGEQLISRMHTQRIFTMAGIDDTECFKIILTLLEGSHAVSFQEFRQKIKTALGNTHLRNEQLEFVFRNFVARGFANTNAQLLAKPIVDSVFPYAEIIPIHDARTSAEHLAMENLGLNGTGIYRRDDPVWLKFRPPWGLSCRCGSNILTVRRAASKGVREAQEWLQTGNRPTQPAWVELPCFDRDHTPCEIFGVRGELPYLLRQLSIENKQEWVIGVLGKLGSDAKSAVPALTDVLKCADSSYIRLTTAMALWNIENQVEIALPFLLDLLTDSDSDVRCQTLEFLGEVGPAATCTFPAILELLSDDDEAVRATAVNVVTSVAASSADAVEALTVTLRDTDRSIRFQGAKTLKEIGPEAKGALANLLEILRDDSEPGRGEVATLVANIAPDSPAVVEALSFALQDLKWQVRLSVVMALAEMGPASKAAYHALTSALRDRSKYVREAAARALKRIDPNSAANSGPSR